MMKNRQRQKDILFSILIFGSAFAVNLLIQKLFTTQTLVPMIFVFGVFLISLKTHGYCYGIISAIVSVFAVISPSPIPIMPSTFLWRKVSCPPSSYLEISVEDDPYMEVRGVRRSWEIARSSYRYRRYCHFPQISSSFLLCAYIIAFLRCRFGKETSAAQYPPVRNLEAFPFLRYNNVAVSYRRNMMKNRQRQKDILFSILIFGSAFAVNLLIQKLFTTQTLVPMIFVFGVFLISLKTHGYCYGIISAIVSVFAVISPSPIPIMPSTFLWRKVSCPPSSYLEISVEDDPYMEVRGVRRSWEIARSRLPRILSFSFSERSFS